jgi:hypothetical protein
LTTRFCNRLDIHGPNHSLDIVLSLGEALSLPDGPVYQLRSAGTRLLFSVPAAPQPGFPASTLITPGLAKEYLAAYRQPVERLRQSLTAWIARQAELRLLPDGYAPFAAGMAQIWDSDVTGTEPPGQNPLLTLEINMAEPERLRSAVADVQHWLSQEDPAARLVVEVPVAGGKAGD